ncbi:hypothetical protein D3C87_546890 [compost metagenome]
MKTFLLSLSLILLIYGKQVRAQTNCNIHGVIADSLKKALSNTTIKLYFSNDSLNATTNDKGYFSFSNIKAKEVTLKVSSIGFKTYLAKYSVKSDIQEIDLGTIVLKAGEISLAEVTIKAKPVAIRYKQDTVEYDANAFHVQDEDRVTDLLKQLPGVEVDENENVTSMGKSMTKLRVNGKDFFTNNVKDFISKLPAGIVAKIQVIDDFGDQANFTGIKIGESQKMLNIVTKPGMDNGQFGGLSINGGTNKQIGGNGNVNLWNGEKQSSGGLGYNIADNGAGLSQNRTFGISHNNKIGKNKSFGLNYNYNGGITNSKTLQAVETVNTLGKLNSQLENDNYSANSGHGFGGSFNQTTKKIFLSSSFNFNYNNTNSRNNSLNYQTGFSKQDFKNNTNNSNNTPSLRANLNFSKKLKKNTLSGSFSFSTSSTGSDQDIITNTLYYDANGKLEKDSLLNRSVYNNNNHKQFGVGLSYGFILKRDSLTTKSISLNYNGSVNINQSDLQTYVLNPTNLTSSKVDSLSVFTQNSTINQSLNLSYYQSGKKNRITGGLNIRPNLVRNNYPELNSTYRNTYINFSPTFNYSRNITQSKTISVNYSGQNSNPSILQMQPVGNTQNLQNIVIGNPNLKSTFSHSVSSNFNYFGKRSNISFQSGFSISTSSNEIVNNIIIIPDTLGAFKQETRFENVNGNYNANINYNLNIPFKSRKYTFSLNGTAGNSRKTAIVNNDKTFNKGFNFSQNISGAFTIKKFTVNMGMGYSMSTNNDNMFGQFSPFGQTPYNLLLNTGQSFFRTKSFSSNFSSSLRLSSLRLGFNGNYTRSKNDNNNTRLNVNTKVQSLNLGASGNVTIFKSYNFNINANKRITKGYSLTNINPLMINIEAGKSFLKNRALNCSISVNDLLNEGNNISQRVMGNSIIESRSNQVMRVVTVGMSYNISTFGGKSFRLRKE